MSAKYTLVRYQPGSGKFEIMVDPDKGLAYKRGELGEVGNVLLVDTIFTDASKGEKASADKLEKAFGTSDPLEVAAIMFEKGVFQLTAQQRKEMLDQKLKQIIYIISRSYVDPKSRLPHPPVRITNALEDVRFQIDPYKDAEEQVKDVVDALRRVLPMSSDNVQIAVKIPAEYTMKSYGIAKGYGKMIKDEWQADGSWIAVIEIPAAMQVEMLEALGKATQGNIQSRIVK
ncbi:MAG: ribosome assembly factor SBDS [Candidatus Bathyarchaeota archaeon]|nr:ribosome assembly factor SBDS [Candidatus Bathyarchaeota archaeon]